MRPGPNPADLFKQAGLIPFKLSDSISCFGKSQTRMSDRSESDVVEVRGRIKECSVKGNMSLVLPYSNAT